MALAVASSSLAYEDTFTLYPPVKLDSFHNSMVESLSHCNMGGAQVTHVIEIMDSDVLDDGVENIELCGQMLQPPYRDSNW